MVFTSYEFVLVFLPCVLLVVLGLGKLGLRTPAKLSLFIASLVFYAWWNPRYVVLLLALLAFNYTVGSWLIHTRGRITLARRRHLVVALGIAANIGVLIYYKYTNFFAAELGFELAQIVLPLGISFMVFQKIAFLVDAYGGGIDELSFLDYGIFVTFFPQLISGPIVHHREIIPQLRSTTSLRYATRVMPVAISFFVFGAFKKLIIADTLSPYVATAFDGAANGAHPGFAAGWTGALAYTLQVYFDFSGYSDIAIGLGLMLGVRLPFNFNSPLKATGPVDYWGRWHISLTRFLTAYIYNPFAMRATRRRMASKQPIRVAGVMTVGAFVRLLAVPTLFTMAIAGAWHGAGYQFVVFGLIHGVYLVANHAHRNLREPPDTNPTRVALALGRAAMFAGAVFAIPFFRADSVTTGLRFSTGMLGFDGGGLAGIGDRGSLIVLGLILLAAQILPNTQEILREQLDAVTTPLERHPGEARDGGGSVSWPRISWRPTIVWALVLGVTASYVMMRMAKTTEFLYFQF